MDIEQSVERILKHNPNRMFDIVKEMHERYGDDIKQFFTCHIENLETYNKYVSLLKNYEGTTGGHWSVEQIKAVSKIDEGLFLQGQILESKSDVQNIKGAIDSYELIVKSYPASAYWTQANKRTIFLKRFYINIR